MVHRPKDKQRGIGLLELILAMVIIAIITLMSIQYFASSKRNTLTAKAVDEIQDIVSIVASLPENSAYSNHWNLNEAVVLSGKLPQEYVYRSPDNPDNYLIGTPWTTSATNILNEQSYFNLQLNQGNNMLVLSISGSAFPNWACQSLADKFLVETAPTDSPGAGTSGCTKNQDNEYGLKLYFTLKPTQDL